MNQSKASIASFEAAINNMTEYLDNLTDATPLHEVEGKLLVLAFAIARGALAHYLSRIGSGAVGKVHVDAAGHERRSFGERPLTYRSLFGPVVIRRADYYAKKHGACARSTPSGHEGKTFQLFAADAITESNLLMPTACGKCGGAFAPNAAPVGAPLIFQTVELPPIIPLVVEYQRHELFCAGCGGHTRAPLPNQVGPSPFGPHLSAVIAAWAIKFHLSRRQIQALCHSLFNLTISVGAIQAIIERVADACEQPVADLQTAIQGAAVVNADETGHAHQGGGANKKRHWLWVAATIFGAIYVVAADRGQAGLGRLLGKDFKGIVCCDRWRPYESLYGDNRQLCWAHLGREGQSAVDRGAMMFTSKDAAVRAKGEALLAWGQAFLALYKAMFKSWAGFKDGAICRKGLFGAMVSHKVAFAQILRLGL